MLVKGATGTSSTDIHRLAKPTLKPWHLTFIIEFRAWMNIITWLPGFLAQNCSGCPWWRDLQSYNSQPQAVACVAMEIACQPPSWCQCPLWLCLNLRHMSKKKSHICLWWLMIPYKLFWQGQINLPALTAHTQFYVSDDVPHALWPFTIGCVKLQFLSLRREASRR